MGFEEELAKATAEKKAALVIAANEPKIDPLADYNRLIAEFRDDVVKAISVLKANGVPSQKALIYNGNSRTRLRYRPYNRRGWYLGGGLCLFDDNTWKLRGSTLQRAEESQGSTQPQSGGSGWRVFNMDWECLGEYCDVAPGETAIWIDNIDYENSRPSDLRDCGNGLEIAFDSAFPQESDYPTYVSLRGALIAGVADLIANG